MSEAVQRTKSSQGNPLYRHHGSIIRIIVEVRHHDSLLRTNDSDDCGSSLPFWGVRSVPVSRGVKAREPLRPDCGSSGLTHSIDVRFVHLHQHTHNPNGRSTVNVLPWPGVLSMLIAPPCAATIHATIESPNPAPPSSRERVLSTR